MFLTFKTTMDSLRLLHQAQKKSICSGNNLIAHFSFHEVLSDRNQCRNSYKARMSIFSLEASLS